MSELSDQLRISAIFKEHNPELMELAAEEIDRLRAWIATMICASSIHSVYRWAGQALAGDPCGPPEKMPE